MKKESSNVITVSGVTESLQKHFSTAIESVETVTKETVVYVKKDSIKKVISYLKEKLDMNYLFSITAVDYPERSPRFDVVYHLKSLKSNYLITVKVKVEDGKAVDSVTDIFGSANWFEREAYDMLGVEFKGHPDLKRIFMWDEFEGHPLRKDFPLYIEE